MPSLSSKNQVGVPVVSLFHWLYVELLFLLRFGGVSMETPKAWAWPRSAKFPRELMGTFWSKHHQNYCLGYFSSLFDQPMKTAGLSLKSFLCCVYLMCIHVIQDTKRLNHRELFQDTNSTPSYGVTVASIQCHNECLLCARRLSWAPVQGNYYPSFSSTTYTRS